MRKRENRKLRNRSANTSKLAALQASISEGVGAVGGEERTQNALCLLSLLWLGCFDG